MRRAIGRCGCAVHSGPGGDEGRARRRVFHDDPAEFDGGLDERIALDGRRFIRRVFGLGNLDVPVSRVFGVDLALRGARLEQLAGIEQRLVTGDGFQQRLLET